MNSGDDGSWLQDDSIKNHHEQFLMFNQTITTPESALETLL